MSVQCNRDDGTQSGPGEQVQPEQDGKDRDEGSLASGRAGGRPTEDDLAKRGDTDRASGEGGDK